MNWFSPRYSFKSNYFAIYDSGDARAVTISPSESDFNVVMNMGRYLHGWKHTGPRGFWFLFGDTLGTELGGTDAMPLSDCGFSDPTLIWQVHGWEDPFSICDCPGTITILFIWSPNVVGDGVAAVVSGCGLTTAGILNSAIPYFISLSQKWSAVSPNPGCVNSSCFICLCRNHSLH